VEIASLAGTRLWSDRDSFNSKEREEQAIVTANIYQLLETTKGLSDIKKSPVTFHKAGHLAHLLTNISAEADPSFQAWHLLQTLHPTPAVGGEPKKLAIDYINEQELYERRYYSGYFGLENQSHNIANYWVNLRCAELVDTANLAVYVGGGITAKSKAEEEWAETEAKTQTILNAMIDRNK
jgi:isochorismate synthase